MERTRVPSVTMIGPSVHLVRLLDTRVVRSVASAAVPVGCLSATEDYEFSTIGGQETMYSGHS